MRWDITYYIMEISYWLPPVTGQRQEHEADEFAAYFLMPEEESRKLEGMGIKWSAEYFGVPEEMVRLRLALGKEEQNGR